MKHVAQINRTLFKVIPKSMIEHTALFISAGILCKMYVKNALAFKKKRLVFRV